MPADIGSPYVSVSSLAAVLEGVAMPDSNGGLEEDALAVEERCWLSCSSSIVFSNSLLPRWLLLDLSSRFTAVGKKTSSSSSLALPRRVWVTCSMGTRGGGLLGGV